MAAKKAMESVQTLNEEEKNTFSRVYLVNSVTVGHLVMLEKENFKVILETCPFELDDTFSVIKPK